MYKFNFNGNDGRCYPDPGEVKKVECGICGMQMNVERNVYGHTGFAEAMGKYRHLHDRFTCSNLLASWHERIVKLRLDAHIYCYNINHKDETEKTRKELEKKVKKILRKVERQR